MHGILVKEVTDPSSRKFLVSPQGLKGGLFCGTSPECEFTHMCLRFLPACSVVHTQGADLPLWRSLCERGWLDIGLCPVDSYQLNCRRAPGIPEKLGAQAWVNTGPAQHPQSPCWVQIMGEGMVLSPPKSCFPSSGLRGAMHPMVNGGSQQV